MGKSSTFSIHTELLGQLPSDPPPATSLIQLLLEGAAYKAQAAEHGILTGFSIVKTARQSCDQIDKTIAEIDCLSNDAEEAGAWSKFNKYWRDIKALEDLLLDEKGFFSATNIKPRASSIAACLADFETWETHRMELQRQLKGFDDFLHQLNGGTATKTPLTWYQQRDDAAIMHSLIILLNGEGRSLSQNASKFVTDLNAALSIIDPATHSEGIIPAIKGVWVVCAAAWESKNGSDPNRKSYLSSRVAWNAIKNFSDILKSGDTRKFQEAYDVLYHVLTVPSVTIAAQNCLQVLKAARDVRRPFVDLNNLLVEYCSELVTLHNKAEYGTKVDNNEAVTKALQNALDAAEAAKTSLPGTTAPWKGEPKDKGAVDAAFNKAFDSLKELFRIYEPTKLTGWDKAKTGASEADGKRFNLLKSRWPDKDPKPATPAGSEVTVYISDPSTGQPRPVKIFDSTKIDMLIWSEGHQFTGANQGGTQLLLGKTIKELNLSGKTIVMTPLTTAEVQAKSRQVQHSSKSCPNGGFSSPPPSLPETPGAYTQHPYGNLRDQPSNPRVSSQYLASPGPRHSKY